MKRRTIVGVSGSLSLSLFLVCQVLSGLSAASSIPTPETKKDQIKIIESELSREKQKYEQFNAQERDLLAQSSDLEREVAEKRQTLEGLKRKIHVTESASKKLQERLAQVEKSLKKVEAKVMERLVVLYKYARRGYIKVLANVRDPDQLRQRVR
jgi:septal ring factor EnvC (AmiA/AmiB activator)